MIVYDHGRTVEERTILIPVDSIIHSGIEDADTQVLRNIRRRAAERDQRRRDVLRVLHGFVYNTEHEVVRLSLNCIVYVHNIVDTVRSHDLRKDICFFIGREVTQGYLIAHVLSSVIICFIYVLTILCHIIIYKSTELRVQCITQLYGSIQMPSFQEVCYRRVVASKYIVHSGSHFGRQVCYGIHFLTIEPHRIGVHGQSVYYVHGSIIPCFEQRLYRGHGSAKSGISRRRFAHEVTLDKIGEVLMVLSRPFIICVPFLLRYLEKAKQ